MVKDECFVSKIGNKKNMFALNTSNQHFTTLVTTIAVRPEKKTKREKKRKERKKGPKVWKGRSKTAYIHRKLN